MIELSGAGTWTNRWTGASELSGLRREIVTCTSDLALGWVVVVPAPPGLARWRGTRLGEMVLGCCWVGIPQAARASPPTSTAHSALRRLTMSPDRSRRGRAVR